MGKFKAHGEIFVDFLLVYSGYSVYYLQILNYRCFLVFSCYFLTFELGISKELWFSQVLKGVDIK